MPRYYFTIEDGRPIEDPTGEELPDDAAARLAAVQIMAEVMTGHVLDLIPEGRLSVQVSDEAQQQIFSVVTTTAVA